MGTFFTILIALIVLGYGYYAARKAVLDTKAGKCTGCDCASGSCHLKEED